jgi:hypothetical protein
MEHKAHSGSGMLKVEKINMAAAYKNLGEVN